jgi:hypothetical protein
MIMLNHILELAQGETSSKVKKRKTSKDEKDMEQVMVAIQNVASTMRKGNLTFERTCTRLQILEEQVVCLVDDIGITPRLQTLAYLYLVRNPNMLRALIGVPMEGRKELLLGMMSDP